MNLPRFIPGPVDYWLAAAFTEFVNGFIAGLGGGSVVGAGMGAATAGTSLGSGLTTLHQVSLALASAVLSAAGNGLKRVIVWHDRNPFPNPWPVPAAAPAQEPTKTPAPVVTT
jgi:hypothetical protein